MSRPPRKFKPTNLNPDVPPPTYTSTNKIANVVTDLNKNARPKNTIRAMDPKIAEFELFCNEVCKNDKYPTIMDSSKVIHFMFYQAMRPLRVKTKLKKEENAKKNNENDEKEENDETTATKFSVDDYRKVMSKYEEYFNENETMTTAPPIPDNCMSERTYNAYKTALRLLHKQQVWENVNSRDWNRDIWLVPLENLHKHVKVRAQQKSRENFEEKIDHHFAPYNAVAQFSVIAATFWFRGTDSTTKAATNLRHLFAFLFTTSGILRSESLFKAELSDFLGVTMKRTRDRDPLYVLVMQIASGKTNKGKKFYGRAMRHRDVRLCPVGAFAFYLGFRFDMTNEMDNKSPDFWLDNSKWFPIKLLINPKTVNGTIDVTKSITAKTYSDAVKTVLREHNIISNHRLHLGRQVGAKILERAETEAEEIRRMGNWAFTTQENYYSNKLPMKAIRNMAGFEDDAGIHINPRIRVVPPEDLQRQTPFAFAFKAFDEIEWPANLEDDRTAKWTVYQFLCCMKHLAVVYLQDAAVILHLYATKPDQDVRSMPIQDRPRDKHPLFDKPIFRSPDFKEVVECLEVAKVELSESVETHLPGVRRCLEDVAVEIKGQKRETKELASIVDGLKEVMTNRLDGVAMTLDSTIDEQRQEMADRIVQFGLAMGGRKRQNCEEPIARGRLLRHKKKKQSAAGTNVNEKETNTTNKKQTPQQNQTTSLLLPEAYYDYRIPTRFATLYDLINMWEGKGETFGGIPVTGGVQRLEDEYKSKWRKTFDDGEGKYFRRVKCIATYLQTVDEIKLDQLNDDFVKKCNNAISTFEGYLKKELKVVEMAKPRPTK